MKTQMNLNILEKTSLKLQLFKNAIVLGKYFLSCTLKHNITKRPVHVNSYCIRRFIPRQMLLSELQSISLLN